jgi:hypothetical protein
MSASVRYGAASAALIGVLTLVAWPFLPAAGRAGVLVAAALALGIQVASFALLTRFRHRVNAFLAVWVGSTLVRMVALGGVALLFLPTGVAGLAPALVALATFFVALLFLEPVYLRSRPSARAE